MKNACMKCVKVLLNQLKFKIILFILNEMYIKYYYSYQENISSNRYLFHGNSFKIKNPFPEKYFIN